MMPPMVCESDEIVVRKKMVVGSGAEIVPESAPARAVRTREEEVSVHLQRYGADIISAAPRTGIRPVLFLTGFHSGHESSDDARGVRRRVQP